MLLERQQTLRALVAWSYDLLNDNEKLLFERLGVFVGGFDLPAAEAVCGADPLMPEDVLDLVMSLVDKSLVMVRETDGESRYRMLETLRDFGLEALEKRGEHARERDAPLRSLPRRWPRRRASDCRVRTSPMDAPRSKPSSTTCAPRSLSRSSGGTDPILAVKFEVALQAFRFLRGYSTEGRKYIHAALALPGVIGVGRRARPCALRRSGAR